MRAVQRSGTLEVDSPMPEDELATAAGGRQVIRLPIVEKGWRVYGLYAVGVGLVFLSTHRLEGDPGTSCRGLATLASTIVVFVAWHVLACVRLELLNQSLVVRRFGFLSKPQIVAYHRIVSVDVIDSGMTRRLVIVERDGDVINLGPWEPMWSWLYRNRIEAAQRAIEAASIKSG